VLDAFRTHRETLIAITEAATYDHDVAEFWRGFNERFAAIATSRIQSGFPDLDLPHAAARAYALVWMTERTLSQHLANPTHDEAAIIDELTLIWQTAARGPEDATAT
jgi:TetR/AcrR family transcriptional regulator, ethionamide resistance regulator